MPIIILLLSVSFLFGDNNYIQTKIFTQYYKKALPYRCDNNLVLTDLLDVGNEIIFRYRVNNTKHYPVSKFTQDEMEKYKIGLMQKTKKRWCKDKEVIALLKNQVILQHLFYFEKSKLLLEFIIDYNECKKIQNKQ